MVFILLMVFYLYLVVPLLEAIFFYLEKMKTAQSWEDWTSYFYTVMKLCSAFALFTVAFIGLALSLM